MRKKYFRRLFSRTRRTKQEKPVKYFTAHRWRLYLTNGRREERKINKFSIHLYREHKSKRIHAPVYTERCECMAKIPKFRRRNVGVRPHTAIALENMFAQKVFRRINMTRDVSDSFITLMACENNKRHVPSCVCVRRKIFPCVLRCAACDG